MHTQAKDGDPDDAVTVTFVDAAGEEHEVVGYPGQNLLQIAHRHGVDMEGACEGSVACSTCHVILEDAVYDALEVRQASGGVIPADVGVVVSLWISVACLQEPTEDEDDMLDQAPGLSMTCVARCCSMLLDVGDCVVLLVFVGFC